MTLDGDQVDSFPTFIHGHNGFGDYDAFPEPKVLLITFLCNFNVKIKMEEMSAVDFIIKKCNEDIGEITILCFGPLTNIALAIQKDPSICNKWVFLN